MRPARIDEPSRAEYGEQLRDQSDVAFRRGSGARDSAPGSDVPLQTKSAGYWSEVPRLENDERELRQRHQPDAQTPKPSTADGSTRPDSHPEDNLKDAIDQVHRSETAITADVRKIAGDNAHGLWLEGLDCRLKGESRLREKIAEQIQSEPDRTPNDMVRAMPDALRYTFCAGTRSYTAGFLDVRQRLEAEGYQMYQCRNFWANDQYKGLNTRWVTPDGQRFEVQFHTAESFHAKHHLTHWSYERLRLPRTITSRTERQELLAFQRDVSSRITIPDGALDIRDYKKDNH